MLHDIQSWHPRPTPRQAQKPRRQKRPRYFLWRSLVLNSNGKAARCLVYQNVTEYASLHEMSLHDAYNHPTVQQARKLFSKSPNQNGPFPAPCNNCSFYARHHGGKNLNKPASLNLPLPVLNSTVPVSPTAV